MLARGVQLVGEMEGTGFEERQWLIQRDGRFVQLTELLYRTLEQVNGERTLDEIAARVTEATEWMVTADHVRQLVQSKLIPLGLLATADGSAPSRAKERPRSPLQINMRAKILNPRVLEPITAVLQLLYTPPILIPLLVAIAISQWWLYFVHGVGGSLDAVIYTPGLLLLLLPLAAVSGVFHELGHAAALRYGGGHVRGIGMGLYLVYPVFYTDTTDAYRLGRWARLRTDLGGFYFHLIFTLGMIALYLVSGQEFFVVMAVLINVDIAYQLLPHLRLDGYWALADLTGIPDFFSQIGPFFRSVLPIPGLKGSRLPRLKPWVKAIFAAYIILIIPLLALFVFFLVAFVPGRVVTVWGSFLNHAREFSVARSNGDFLALVTSAVQLLILALVMVGIAYLIYQLSRGAIAAVWNWSKPTPMRRLVGAMGSATAVAAVAFLWVPQLPFAGGGVPAGPAGTESFDIAERSHVPPPVSYPQTPPVGGNHAPFWQNCGFYDAPVLNETAVHALEHGAVWITYRPDLAGEQVQSLRRLAHDQSHVLVSPFPDLPAPVVASAWGKQLRLDSAHDARLNAFVRAFRLGRQAPEAGERCTGGVGQPA